MQVKRTGLLLRHSLNCNPIPPVIPRLDHATENVPDASRRADHGWCECPARSTAAHPAPAQWIPLLGVCLGTAPVGPENLAYCLDGNANEFLDAGRIVRLADAVDCHTDIRGQCNFDMVREMAGSRTGMRSRCGCNVLPEAGGSRTGMCDQSRCNHVSEAADSSLMLDRTDYNRKVGYKDGAGVYGWSDQSPERCMKKDMAVLREVPPEGGD